ncbi:hypothetical protein SCANM63S_05652 [Streptomyces canarius]
MTPALWAGVMTGLLIPRGRLHRRRAPATA